MYPIIRLVMLTAAVLSLAACGTTRQAKLSQTEPSQQAAVIDPDEPVFRAAMKQYLAQQGAPASSQYEYVRQDLDGDGRREAIVMLQSPFYTWCSGDGCKMVILKAFNDHFSVASEIAPVRGPLLISDTRTKGWRDLVVRVSGRQMRPKDVAMKFDGRSYPEIPDFATPLPEVIQLANLNGTQIFP